MLKSHRLQTYISWGPRQKLQEKSLQLVIMCAGAVIELHLLKFNVQKKVIKKESERKGKTRKGKQRKAKKGKEKERKERTGKKGKKKESEFFLQVSTLDLARYR